MVNYYHVSLFAIFSRLSEAQIDLDWVLSYLSKKYIGQYKRSGSMIDMVLFHWINNLHIQMMTKSI